MTRFLTRFGVTAVALALITLPAAGQDTDVTGDWELSFEDPQGGGPVTMLLTLTQDGSEVTGTVELSAVPDARISNGMIDGSMLSFGLDVLYEGQWFTLGVGGAVDGDSVSGYIELPEGSGSIPFTGARAEGND